MQVLGRPRGVSAKVQERMARMSHLLGEGMSVYDAGEIMGIASSQAEYCAEMIHKHLLDAAIVPPEDLPCPVPPEPGARRWQDKSACRGHGDLFFGPDSEMRADRLVREAKAATLCRVCPVLGECLDWACERREAGWWGGMNEAERKTYRQRERRRRQAASAAGCHTAR